MSKLEQIQKEIQEVLEQMRLTLDNTVYSDLLQQYHKLKKIEGEYMKNEKLYQETNQQRVLVAEKGNKIIGCIIVSVETEAKDLGNVGCTCVRFSETHQGIGSNLVILSTQYLHNLGLKNASLAYSYSGLDKMYGNAGYKISCYYMMAVKNLKL